MIKVTGLYRKYDNFTAVDDVSFTINKGEVIGLLGHNGAGKTTIMKMLTGFLEPNAGSIEIDGLDITANRARIQSKIGYLPENCPLYLEMSIIEYLDYAAELKGLTAEDKIRAISDVIASTELRDKATQKIQTLSRGYRQRVGVAQALLHKPDILILDEPTNGLDPTQILHMRELIKDLSQSATVILSTHILQEVQAMCERVLIMRNGKLITDARLLELQHSHVIKLISDCSLDDLQTQIADGHGINSIDQTVVQDHLQHYELTLQNPQTSAQDAIPAIVKSLSVNNIAISAIYPEQHDLETVFRQVNTSDNPFIDGEKVHAA